MNNKKSSLDDLREIASKLQKLKKTNPAKYFEYKGRINALFEKEMEKESLMNWKEWIALEQLRDKLIKSIETNGRASEETIRISQELDILIVKEMKVFKKCL